GSSTPLLAAVTAIGIFLACNVTQFAQGDLPARSGHVNDFARVLDDATRKDLEETLENFKQKTGIQFDVATVETTSGQDIAEFSQRLAQNWKLIGRTAKGKNVLLVVSANDKTSFTQFSSGVPAKLPEGIFGDIGQRLKTYLASDRTAEGVTTIVQYFVSAVARSQNLDPDSLNAAVAVANNNPSPAVSAAAETPSPAPAESPTTAADTPPPTVAATPLRSNAASRTDNPASDTDAADESEEVELTLTKPAATRITLLKDFIDTHPDSTVKHRAIELLISSYATYGDELLRGGDGPRGIEQLMLAITEAPLDASENLFSRVIAQIPLNLYLRSETTAADRAARSIAAKFGNDPKKLLAVASYYVTLERGDEARQLVSQALQLAPQLAEAHQSMAMALHISFRLTEAADEYKRAFELDPNLKGIRRNLADLRRALGKDEEALGLYRQQLATDPTDKGARAGAVISLLNLGRRDEARAELDSALKADAANLPLLASTAYWFAAHNEPELAIALGTKAVQVQPRHAWSQIAVARALIAQGNPLEAERAIRFARSYAKFPTLDYELANALAASGLFEEAAEVLTQKFRIKNNQIETLLGGHVPATGSSFIELLAPERQGSILQLASPDTEANAKILKDLLMFATTINPVDGGKVNEAAVVAAAKEFASGNDAARAHRELYVASRLLQKGIGFQTAFELATDARTYADAALTVPALALAVQADEYREARARAIAAGGTPDVPEAPRNLLTNLLRGRIEDISGWALFNLDKTKDAIDHLQRAVNILPPGTPARRIALWHLGAAFEQEGNTEEALSSYINSYNAGEPDSLRRSVIEKLYRRAHGSLEGLEERIGKQPAAASDSQSANTISPAPAPAVTPAPEAVAPTPAPAVETPASTPEPSPTPATENKPAEANSPATLIVSGTIRDS
ncbi:MAG TPA: TPM domain-containing protein, partial [Pyrinomonadaceae bacterium]|nr:TPM domain-containing protein [Pyrinomonadaceae bacterium]